MRMRMRMDREMSAPREREYIYIYIYIYIYVVVCFGACLCEQNAGGQRDDIGSPGRLRRADCSYKSVSIVRASRMVTCA